MIDAYPCRCPLCNERVHQLWHCRPCFLCGELGHCKHREFDVDLALIEVELLQRQREHAPAPERPPAGVRRKPAGTLRVVGSSGKAGNHD